MNILSDQQFADLKKSRLDAMKGVQKAAVVKQRHPGPLGEMAYHAAQDVYSKVHNDVMNEYHRRAHSPS